MQGRQMWRSVLAGLLLIQGAWLAAPVRAAPFMVQSGQPRAEIVVSDNPARMTKWAARELQEYVKKISGAELPIVVEPTGRAARIYVGVSEHTRRLGLEVSDLKDGAYRMASGDNWLALLGPDGDYVPTEPWGRNRSRPEQQRILAEWDRITGDLFNSPFLTHFRHYYPDPEFWDTVGDRGTGPGHPSPTEHAGVWSFDEAGTLNAVQAFLHELGVRWYAPGEIGEVVPQRTDIALPQVDRVVRPDFPLRFFQYGYAQHGMGDVGVWNLRLGFNPGGRIVGHVQLCHGLKFVLMRPEMREAHPEIYALMRGERHEVAPCLSSETLFEKHVAYVRAMFDHYNEPMVNIDLPDGFGPGCECERCLPQRTPERGRDGLVSDLVFAYLDRVAREVYKSHPDRMVGALAYSSYRLPPLKIDQLSPNLALTWSRAAKRRTMYQDRDEVADYLRLRDEWLAKLPSKCLIMWESYLNAEPKGRALPAVFPRAIAEDIRGLKGLSVG
ncbi:MAG: DUF4838 domain-containing protein, partial [Kiritimatiellia bacterium]